MNELSLPRPSGPGSGRLMSLDVFRGATIASMILVNNPGNWGAVYPPLLHAPWHGWTFTDTVFPFFVWIVGVAIPLSFNRRLEQGRTRAELFGHVVRRAAIIFALGFFLNFFTYLVDVELWHKGLSAWLHKMTTEIRIPGVLQRIAVCYLFASLIFLCTKLRGQLIWLAGLLAGYWLLMKLVPVPGFGAGVLDERGNLAQYLDNVLLGNHVAYGHRTPGSLDTWDPEGILSTLPAIATCLFGILAGQLIRSKRSAEEKTAWLFVAGNVLLFVGLVMNWWFPINKKIWTSSYSVFMAGLAMNCLAVCYWLIDVKGWQRWAKPFAVYGMNAITVFVLAGILGRLSLAVKVTNLEGKLVPIKAYLFDTFFMPLASGPHAVYSTKIASLLWALMYVTGLYLVAYVMYRRKWFLKV